MEYNGTNFSFLNSTGKRLVKMAQKANHIVNLINNQNEFSYDFSDAVKRFKAQDWDLDNFCSDETLAYHLLNKNNIEDTVENREIYYLTLRNHLLKLQEEGEF